MANLITFSLVNLKKEKYDQYERELVKEGVEKFPSNNWLSKSHPRRKGSTIANNFDELAQKEFDLKNIIIQLIIGKAIEILPSESAYYLI